MMRKASNNNEKVMEEAIAKASTLISLLQKQNQELRVKISHDAESLEALRKQNDQNIEFSLQIKAKNDQLHKKIQSNENQIRRLTNQNKELRQKLEERVKNNKQLHQKISLLTKQVKQLNQSSKTQKTKYLSLQNQNQFLLKKLQKYENHEVQIQKCVEVKIQQQKKEFTALQGIKNAFSRRCSQLKDDNIILLKSIDEYELTIANLSKMNETLMNKLIILQEKSEDSLYIYDQLKKIIEIHIGSQSANDIRGQADQITNFITYRFGHIENLIHCIFQKLSKPLCKITGLNEASIAAQRLSSYLNQLSSK